MAASEEASEEAMVAQVSVVKCHMAWADQRFSRPMEADNSACLDSQCLNTAVDLVVDSVVLAAA